jgi:hypothetical protein
LKKSSVPSMLKIHTRTRAYRLLALTAHSASRASTAARRSPYARLNCEPGRNAGVDGSRSEEHQPEVPEGVEQQDRRHHGPEVEPIEPGTT